MQRCQPCAAPFYETVLCPPSPKGRPSEQCGDDDQHCHGKQIRHGTSPGHIEQSKAGKDQPLSSAARQPGSANGNLQLEKYGAITIPGLLSYKRNLRHSRPNDRRRADVDGPLLCRLAASYCSATGRVLLSQFSDKEVLERLGSGCLSARPGHL
jgi:hypothetical protein